MAPVCCRPLFSLTGPQFSALMALNVSWAAGRLLLAELEDEAQWADAFARSQDVIGKLADEALAEFVSGNTRPSLQPLPIRKWDIAVIDVSVRFP